MAVKSSLFGLLWLYKPSSKSFGCVVHNLRRPPQDKKCPGIVLDNIMETVKVLMNVLGPHGTTARRELYIDFIKIHFYVEGVAVVLIISQCSLLLSFITLQL